MMALESAGWCSMKEACRILNARHRNIHKLVNDGKLSAWKRPGSRVMLLKRDEIEAMAKAAFIPKKD